MTERSQDRNAERAERRRNVARLRRGEGLGPRGIARRLSVPVTTVHRDLVKLGLVDKVTPGETNAPPAPPGNGRAMTHGLESQRVVGAVIEPRARELVPGIIDVHPHLDERRDGPAVLRYALKLAKLEHAYSWLAQQPDELFADRAKGTVHGLHGRIEMWERSAAADEERLAISPRERTRLKLDRLGVAGRAGALERLDFSGFSEAELETFVRLREKAVAMPAEAEEAG